MTTYNRYITDENVEVDNVQRDQKEMKESEG